MFEWILLTSLSREIVGQLRNHTLRLMEEECKSGRLFGFVFDKTSGSPMKSVNRSGEVRNVDRGDLT